MIMPLSLQFEADERVDIMERYFRESETAGRLTRPKFVATHDYVLSMPSALSIMMRVAGALGYAHKNNLTHRDIKPANVMYDPQSDYPEVTDFEIAYEIHVDIRQRNLGIPACVATIANDKALAKEPEQRYQSSDQMAKALLCLSSLRGLTGSAAEAVQA